MTALLSMFCGAAVADVQFAPHEVVGWDELRNSPIVKWGDSGGAHTEMGGYYTLVTHKRMRAHDDMVFDLSSAPEFREKLPETKKEYHSAQMKKRCELWKKTSRQHVELCEN